MVALASSELRKWMPPQPAAEERNTHEAGLLDDRRDVIELSGDLGIDVVRHDDAR